MRIPLDYYRILGLPIQATADQLQQAHRDRALQLPRREYSDAAITARKQLLDEAYDVLAEPEQRQAYDASFLAKTYDLDADRGGLGEDGLGRRLPDDQDFYSPSIEIEDHQLIGALLILLELGEYELVLKLGRPYLSGGTATLKSSRLGEPAIIRADIVLTVALACLELGREQWQQGHYENAAEALETGQDLLLRESLFPGVRGEIQTDLYKLRPYRILELLALSEDNASDRQHGLRLLQDMLNERGGIDGGGNDQSGLNIDDFLRFIQQLRGYLFATEQQALFEAEANRPSAVATYLAVYALLARGFAERQPALVRRAKLMLLRLSSRQDVHLEQAVCALLLGQTEEASRALELSQEYEPLAFIREHSQGSPDLLPGLCLYGERWLQEEVFPHFRDLAQRRSSLKDYFADEQVQAYLEALPADGDDQNEWQVLPTPSGIYGYSQGASSAGSRVMPLSTGRGNTAGSDRLSSAPWGSESRSSETTQSTLGAYANHNGADASHRAFPQRGATATLTSTPGRTAAAGVPAMPAAERVSPPSPRPETGPARGGGNPEEGRPRPREMGRGQPASNVRNGGGTTAPRVRPSSPSRADSPGILPKLIVIGLGILGIGILGFLALRWLTQPPLQGEQPSVRLDRPVVPQPATSQPSTAPGSITGPLNEAVAQQVIQTWLSAKSAALGANHDLSKLDQILVDPQLSQVQQLAQDAKRDNWHWKYEHNLKVTNVEMSDVTPDQARIQAEVTEKADFFEGDRLNQELSRNETLQIQYDLVRRDNQWRIRDVKVLQ